MDRLFKYALVVWLALSIAQSVWAGSVVYNIENISGSRWECTYSITNNSLQTGLKEFTIYFKYGLYKNISVGATPDGWNSKVAQPALIFNTPDNGFVDLLAKANGLPYGSTLTGLTIDFDWIGLIQAGTQSFDFVDPITFATLESGKAAAPIPGTLLLFGSGLIGLSGLRRKILHEKQP